MIVHLIDGTYELFRQFYGLRQFIKGKDRPYGAVVGVLNGVLAMFEQNDTYVGVATDHVIESFRNRLWADYKTGDGIEPALLAQFHPLVMNTIPTMTHKRSSATSVNRANSGNVMPRLYARHQSHHQGRKNVSWQNWVVSFKTRTPLLFRRCLRNLRSNTQICISRVKKLRFTRSNKAMRGGL